MMAEIVFLKENIVKSKQNDKTGKNALKLIKFDKQNEFLFEKNIGVFIELVDFLRGRDDVFAITGFSLCGKSLATSVIPQIITENTIFHSFKCSVCSTLDDLLLSLFETFKTYAQKKLVRIPKIETQNFQERINIYLSRCENPIIILLDGLNEITNQQNKDEIMSFLSHTVNLENIKLIITTRAFEVSDLKNINLRLSTTLIKPLTLDDLKNYCLKYVINSDGIEDFYKLSRGHYFNLSLAMNYIQPTSITIKEFVAEVEAQKKSIDDFVISKNLSLIPNAYDNILWVMSMSDFGMPVSNLLEIPDSSEEQINFLHKKGIIEIFGNCVYVKDYFKKEIVKSIEPLAKINIVKGIIKFLEAQLPLKPAIRELKLSRLTIRNEIEKLNNIVNKAQEKEKKPELNKSNYMSILGYSRQFKTNWDGFDEIIMPKGGGKKEKISLNNVEKPSEQEIEEISINEIADVDTKEDDDAFDFANKLKDKYNYSGALSQYNDALSVSIESSDKLLTMQILIESAECYYKLGKYQSAIENYGKAHELAKSENLVDTCYEIMLKIAEIYKTTYKKELALEIYKDIMFQDGIDENIKLLAELNLFELSFSNLKPDEIVKKYLNLLEKAKNNKEITAKIHFRLGFLYDRASSFDNAIKHYKLSIATGSNVGINENLSSCYYNLAEIYSYKKDYENALEMYLKSFATDEMTNNYEGLLITARKIAKIYEKQKNDLAQTYYERAIEIAKETNDNYPIACAIIDLGDYYYRKKEDVKALKVYIYAKKVLVNQLTYENENAINDRINDLKVRLGKGVVDDIMKEFS